MCEGCLFDNKNRKSDICNKCFLYSKYTKGTVKKTTDTSGSLSDFQSMIKNKKQLLQMRRG